MKEDSEINYKNLKEKYRENILKFHPDKCSDKKEYDKFIQIQQDWLNIKESLNKLTNFTACEMVNKNKVKNIKNDSSSFLCQCGETISFLSSEDNLIPCETCSRIFFIQ